MQKRTDSEEAAGDREPEPDPPAALPPAIAENLCLGPSAGSQDDGQNDSSVQPSAPVNPAHVTMGFPSTFPYLQLLQPVSSDFEEAFARNCVAHYFFSN